MGGKGGGGSVTTRSRTVTITAQVRTINELGEATSDWTAFDTFTVSANSKDPLRYSRKIAAPLGFKRYQIRLMRSNTASTSSAVFDQVRLTGVRAYGGAHPDYGDVTMIEAKVKATNQLNGDVGSKINVIATRKLYPVTATGFDATKIATRSMADACAYMVTAQNGGRQADSIIDWQTLFDLRTAWEGDGHHFDYRFRETTSVMDAAAKASACGRAVPYMPGGLFSLVRNELQTLPSCVFSADNVENMKTTTRPRTPDSPTCINMTYTNSGTWEKETVVCLDEDGSEDNPSEITLDGCTDRQQAYEIGMFLYYQDRSERTEVSFTTGLIGHIPALLSKILVPNPMGGWVSGLIMAVRESQVWLSAPVDFKGQPEGSLYFSNLKGEAQGPYTVYTTDYAHCVAGDVPGLMTLEHSDLRAAHFLFGPAGTEPLAMRVSKVLPQGRDKVTISGAIIDDDIFADPGDAPAIGETVLIRDLLSGFSLIYTGESGSDHAFLVNWIGTAEKVRIELDAGGGYSTLQDLYPSHGYAFATPHDNITVRVTPYDESDVLHTDRARTQTQSFETAPTGLAATTSEGGISVTWDAHAQAITYELALMVSGVEKLAYSTTGTAKTIPMSSLEFAGGPWDEFDLTLKAVIPGGVTPSATLSVTVNVLAAPAKVDFQARLANGVSISWDSVADAESYVVCYSSSSGDFIPSDANKVYEGAQPAANIGGLTMTGSYKHYFKVAAKGGYNNPIADLNFTSALEVTPATDDISVHTVSLPSGSSQNYTGPAGGSNYTYQLSGTATGDDVTVQASLTGGGSGSAYCTGQDGGGSTSAALAATSSGSSNVCNVAISGGGSFSGSLIITRIS